MSLVNSFLFFFILFLSLEMAALKTIPFFFFFSFPGKRTFNISKLLVSC